MVHSILFILTTILFELDSIQFLFCFIILILFWYLGGWFIFIVICSPQIHIGCLFSSYWCCFLFPRCRILLWKYDTGRKPTKVCFLPTISMSHDIFVWGGRICRALIFVSSFLRDNQAEVSALFAQAVSYSWFGAWLLWERMSSRIIAKFNFTYWESRLSWSTHFLLIMWSSISWAYNCL